MATRKFTGRPARASRRQSPDPALDLDNDFADDLPLSPDSAVLEQLSSAIALVECVSIALRPWEPDQEIGSIAVTLKVACKALGEAHGAVDHALGDA